MVKQITKRIITQTRIRFAVVGVMNTGFDFILFNSLLIIFTGNHPTRLEIVLFNSLSASVVAIFSFVLNRRYVFKAQHTPHHYVVYFILITLIGLYVIQNAIIYLITHLAHNVIDSPILAANIGKLFATGGSMLWNYLMYKHVVFKTDK